MGSTSGVIEFDLAQNISVKDEKGQIVVRGIDCGTEIIPSGCKDNPREVYWQADFRIDIDPVNGEHEEEELGLGYSQDDEDDEEDIFVRDFLW